MKSVELKLEKLKWRSQFWEHFRL